MSEGYGQDIYCLDSLRTGRYARGAQLVAQAMYRRLTTSRGTLRGGEEEDQYGLDLSEYLGAVGVDAAIASLPTRVRAELLKDDRVLTIAVTVAHAEARDKLDTIAVRVSGVLADESGVFDLTLSVNDVDTALLGLETT